MEVVISGEKLEITNLSFPDDHLINVACNEDQSAWAIGEHGSFYHFRTKWTKNQLSPDYRFEKVKWIANRIWILGNRPDANGVRRSGLVLTSDNDGVSWGDRSPLGATAFTDLSMSGNVGWLVGDGGVIYRTADGGSSWIEFPSPTRNDLKHLFFLNEQNIWIGGINHTILKYRPNS